jgi:hypothetical protein
MITFSETITEHATRLNTSYNFVRIRRRILIAKWNDQDIKTTSDDIPYHLFEASIADLHQTLKIRMTNGGDPGDIHFIPANDLPDTADLNSGRLKQTLRDFGLLRFGGEGKSRRTLLPPYGYRKNNNGLWLPFSPAADAIAAAFEMMVNSGYRTADYSTHPDKISWSQISSALNEAGYTRKDGGPWKPDDVRTLIRIPTYAGYIAQKNTPIYRADFIPTPVVDLTTFTLAAANGRGRKGMAWLPQLEAVLKKSAEDNAV